MKPIGGSAHHVLDRHWLRGHGGGAPLRGGHGLVLPVLASGQLLLSGLAPVHLRPEDVSRRLAGAEVGVFFQAQHSLLGRSSAELQIWGEMEESEDGGVSLGKGAGGDGRGDTHCPRGWPETSPGRWPAACLRGGWPWEGEAVRGAWEPRELWASAGRPGRRNLAGHAQLHKSGDQRRKAGDT